MYANDGNTDTQEPGPYASMCTHVNDITDRAHSAEMGFIPDKSKHQRNAESKESNILNV